MTILNVGKKESLAFELRVSDSEDSEGMFFIYLNNKKIGQDNFNEDITSFFERIFEYDFDREGKNIFKLESQTFVNIMERFWNQQEVENFSNDQLMSIDEEFIIRAGYAFDDHIIAVVPYLDEEKIIVFGEDITHFYEATIQRGSFFSYLNQLKSLYFHKIKKHQ